MNSLSVGEPPKTTMSVRYLLLHVFVCVCVGGGSVGFNLRDAN
jgi:hypothetical protein